MRINKSTITEFNKLLEQESNLTTVLEMTLNSLMHSERENYLENFELNKGNGYRKDFAVGMGKQIELPIPRDRIGMFQPMVLSLIRDQKQQLEGLLFELYIQILFLFIRIFLRIFVKQRGNSMQFNMFEGIRVCK